MSEPVLGRCIQRLERSRSFDSAYGAAGTDSCGYPAHHLIDGVPMCDAHARLARAKAEGIAEVMRQIADQARKEAGGDD
jgi:hypothetical protein